MTWTVYILRCADGSLYTGITTDAKRRLAAHNSGKGSKAVRARLPACLVYAEPHADRSAALRREAEIKGWPRSAKLALARPGKSYNRKVRRGKVRPIKKGEK